MGPRTILRRSIWGGWGGGGLKTFFPLNLWVKSKDEAWAEKRPNSTFVIGQVEVGESGPYLRIRLPNANHLHLRRTLRIRRAHPATVSVDHEWEARSWNMSWSGGSRQASSAGDRQTGPCRLTFPLWNSRQMSCLDPMKSRGGGERPQEGAHERSNCPD